MTPESEAQLGSIPIIGSKPGAKRAPQPKRKGFRAAQNRTRRLREGLGQVGPQQEALLQVGGKLLCHFENVSAALYENGELRQDGEPKQALGKLIDLSEEIRKVLDRLYGDGQGETDDILARLRGLRT